MQASRPDTQKEFISLPKQQQKEDEEELIPGDEYGLVAMNCRESHCCMEKGTICKVPEAVDSGAVVIQTGESFTDALTSKCDSIYNLPKDSEERQKQIPFSANKNALPPVCADIAIHLNVSGDSFQPLTEKDIKTKSVKKQWYPTRVESVEESARKISLDLLHEKKPIDLLFSIVLSNIDVYSKILYKTSTQSFLCLLSVRSSC